MTFNDLKDKMTQVSLSLITIEDFYGWLDENISVKKYIPIVNKYAIVRMFSNNFVEDLNNEIIKEEVSMDYIYLTYDINLMFSILFEYIDVFVFGKDRTTSNYDLVVNSGLYSYIIKKCEEDYKKFEDICKLMSGVNDVNIMNMFTSLINSNLDNSKLEEAKDIVNNIDKEKLEILKVVEQYNNPVIKKAIDNISKESMKKNIKKDGE